ncbi:MAG: phosphoribosylformylglycinamidine synthase subunit PurL [SAR202 cluster bacterium]|nr:phosphoribosylformylglycinamidine synthase subunit PurL [SAR202 cluster bacterium]MQG42985.1 phosphoribosylformylglycinamidine synthase subunit PurL [SAR202 cluster bacterium]|tara:strand:- start:5789 stop:7984 length:2196 start_codon:yes stop_codon:yes gene_type:complete
MVTEETLKELALTFSEYELIIKKLGREPNELELGLFGALWSEHCGYKHTKKLLRTIKSKSKNTLTEAGAENAGAINIGDNKAIVMKMESHNHPSAIEPYEGAATGVGGIVRDIFAMGARPIALLNSLRFSNLSDDRNLQIAKGVVQGISGYGNCLGIPNIGGECSFDDSYDDNPLVNAMCIGLVDKDKILSAKAENPGDLLIIIGAETGRDGIHGASGLASQNFEETVELRSAVQVGNPFLEKLLIEACLEISEMEELIGMQDCGAAGITSAAIEMAERSNLGLSLDISKVPVREQGMTPYEVMLSESQERMLIAVKDGEYKRIFEILDKWDLKCSIIGKFIKENVVKIYDKNKLVSETSIEALTNPPEYSLDQISKNYKPETKKFIAKTSYKSFNEKLIKQYLKELLKSDNLVSKKSIYKKYDHHVQTNTVVEPGEDSAVIRIKDTDKMLVFSCDGNSRLCALDPKTGSEINIAEACRNISVMGGTPIALTDGLNFGDPTKPKGAFELVETFKGFNKACEIFDTPIISGNASLFNEGHKSSINPTPIIGAMGIMDKTIKPPKKSFIKNGDKIGFIGKEIWGSDSGLSGSEFQRIFENELSGDISIDLDFEKEIQEKIRKLIKNNLVISAHDVSIGGFITAIVLCCEKNNLGAEINMSVPDSWAGALFGEDPTRILFSFKEEDKSKISEILGNESWKEIGTVTEKNIKFENILIESEPLILSYNKGFSKDI